MKQSFVAWPNVFTPAEMDAIEEMGDAMIMQGASGAAPASTRFAWLEREERSAVVYDRLAELVPRVNQQFYRFDVTALEKVQYGVCQGSEGALLDWHTDYNARGPHSRKISIMIQLSNPSRYQGGDIEFRIGPGPGAAPRARGTAIVFPSIFLHRVAPVTSGAFKMLVGWTTGPEFC